MKKTKQYPSKTTINLVIKEKSQFRPSRLLPLLLLVALVVAAFTKFAVLDRLDQVTQAQSVLSDTQARQRALEESTADYDEVAIQYRQYASNWMSDDERARVDRIEILDLMEAELMTAAGVESFTLADNILSVNLSGITLEQTSVVVQKLNTYPIVVGVSVYTATNQAQNQQSGQRTQVSMVITLTTPVAEAVTDPTEPMVTEEGGTGLE